MNNLAYVAAAVVAVAGFSVGSQAMAEDAFDMASGGSQYVSYAAAAGFFQGLPRTIFDMADDNGDGQLDQSEFTELEGLTAGYPAHEQSSR